MRILVFDGPSIHYFDNHFLCLRPIDREECQRRRVNIDKYTAWDFLKSPCKPYKSIFNDIHYFAKYLVAVLNVPADGVEFYTRCRFRKICASRQRKQFSTSIPISLSPIAASGIVRVLNFSENSAF